MKRLALLLILFAVPAQAWTRKPLFQVVPGSPFTGGGGSSLSFPLLGPDYPTIAYSFANSPTTGIAYGGGYISMSGANGSGLNQAGINMTLNPGRGTGSGAGGSFFVAISSNGNASGSSVNAAQNVITFNGDNFTLGGISSHSVGTGIVSGYHRTTGDTDGAAGNLFLTGGMGTGTGVGGNVFMQAAPPASGTGEPQNALQTFLATSTTSGDITITPLLLASGVRGAVVLGGSASSNLKLDRTITAAGTTGARTIDKMAGTVNFAAAATAIVVTDALVTTSSIIFGVMRTADATCTDIKSIVPAAGSFTITLNVGCTAETSVGFWVTN